MGEWTHVVDAWQVPDWRTDRAAGPHGQAATPAGYAMVWQHRYWGGAAPDPKYPWGGTFYVSDGLGFLYNDHFRGGRGGARHHEHPADRALAHVVREHRRQHGQRPDDRRVESVPVVDGRRLERPGAAPAADEAEAALAQAVLGRLATQARLTVALDRARREAEADAGVPAAPVADVADIVAAPQTAALEMLDEIGSPTPRATVHCPSAIRSWPTAIRDWQFATGYSLFAIRCSRPMRLATWW